MKTGNCLHPNFQLFLLLVLAHICFVGREIRSKKFSERYLVGIDNYR